MAIQKSNYSENENTNGKISDDGKDANEKRCMKCIRNAAELGLAPAQFMLTSLGKMASSKTRKKPSNGIEKQLSRKWLKQSLNLKVCTY